MPLLANITNTIKGLINYSDPVKTLTAIMTGLSVPKPNMDMVLGYAKNKKDNPEYLDAVINLIMTYYTRFQTEYTTVSQEVYYDYFNVEQKIIYLESITRNPLTGQPYGFGSVDLETGEVYEDGVLVKTLTGTPKQTNTAANTASTNILPWVLIIGGAVLLRKKKRKNK